MSKGPLLLYIWATFTKQMYSYCHAKGQLLQAKEAQNDELECRRSSKNR